MSDVLAPVAAADAACDDVRDDVRVGAAAPAVVQVRVAPEKMQAWLSVEAADGGAPVTLEQLNLALRAAGVVFGIKPEALDAVVSAGRAEFVLAAEGDAAVAGADARFEALIPDIKDRKPKLDDRAPVDFRELGLFVSVKPGQPLMRRTPATPGTAGRNVLGETLPPTAGVDQPFALKLDGAAVDPKDPTLLVATLTGQPVQVSFGVSVEPVLTVAAVDLSTGNIDFEGSVNVVGDVRSGMKIRANGDVSVGGVVEAAEVQAKGSITIKGGIIGHSEWSVGSARATATIVAGGDVHTRFAERAIIESGSAIHVLDASRQSQLSAIHKVVIGKGDGLSGHLIGGRVVATQLVLAGAIGSATHVATRVEVGLNPLLLRKLEALEQQLKQLEKEQGDLVRLLNFARANPQRLAADVVQKAQLTAVHLNQQVAACIEENRVFQQQLGLAKDARITAGQRIYGGVIVKIGDMSRSFDEERAAGTLHRVVDLIDFV